MDNKTIINKLSAKLGKSREDVGKLLEGFVAVITESSCELDSIAIPGFGTFVPVKSEEYIAINPSNGKRTLYPPHVEMSFTSSNVLNKKINSDHE